MSENLSRLNEDALIEEVANHFSLFSEPTRLKILNSLCTGEKSVGEIVTAVASTQANVSRQIGLLYRGKILAKRKDGTQVFYRVDDQRTLVLCQSVCREISDRIGIVSETLLMDVKKTP
jgi:DNA-binding transcriptional ArsR family regulator